MADPRRLREILGFGYGAPSPAMSALEPFHAGVDPAYMPQDVVTESPGEGPSPYVRRGMEGLLGTVMPDRWASQWADKLNAVADFNPLQGAYDIGKGIGDAVQGGDKLSLAMSMIPGKAADEIVPAVKAAQKGVDDLFTPESAKEMKAKIRKILKGETDAPTSPRLGEGDTPFSKVKARRPVKEMSAVYLPNEEMLPERFIKPEDFKVGDYVYPFPGDRTIAGRSLYGVNEMDFPNAVDLLGGGGYMRGKFQQGPDRSGWANQLSAAARHANDIRRLSEKGGTVHGGFVTMGGDASDFSNMSGDAVRQALLTRRPFISPNDEELYNKLMREGGTAEDPLFPDFPGIFNMSDEYLNSSGDMRKKLIKRMDSTDVMDRGFPDVGAIRKALTEPDLYNANNLDMGWAFSKMDPEGRLITDPSIVHPSYDTQIGGTYEGRFKHLAPMEIHSPDFWRARERVKPGENASQREYTYKLRLPGQEVTPEWIDLNMGYQEAAENGNIDEYLRRVRQGAGF